MDWWKGFFTTDVYPLAELLDEAATAAEVRALVGFLPKGCQVLDVACGVGRHAIPLAKKGFRVTAMDYSESYLAEARRRAKKDGASVRLVQGDMRALGFSRRFDVVLNLWTSFGYCPRLCDDRRTLRSMFRALRPGGMLCLEVVDPLRFAAGYAEQHWARMGRYWQLEATRLRPGKDPALLAERHYIGPSGRVRSGSTFVRLYSRRRLRLELERAGFTGVRLTCGLVEQGRQGPPSRILALARRPGGRPLSRGIPRSLGGSRVSWP